MFFSFFRIFCTFLELTGHELLSSVCNLFIVLRIRREATFMQLESSTSGLFLVTKQERSIEQIKRVYLLSLKLPLIN